MVTENYWSWLDAMDDKALIWANSYLDKKGLPYQPYTVLIINDMAEIDKLKHRVSIIHDEGFRLRFKQAYRQEMSRRNKKIKQKKDYNFTLKVKTKSDLDKLAKDADITPSAALEQIISSTYLEFSSQRLLAKQIKEETKLLKAKHQRTAETTRWVREKMTSMEESEDVLEDYVSISDENTAIKEQLDEAKLEIKSKVKELDELKNEIKLEKDRRMAIEQAMRRFRVEGHPK